MTGRALLAAGALALGACGDDAATPADTASDTSAPDGVGDTMPDTGTPYDGAGDTAAPDTGDATSAEEVTVCGSLTCDAPPPEECSPDKLATWTYGTAATCESDASGFPICRYALTDVRCADGDACRVEADAAVCAAPRTTCEVAFSRVGSWVSAAVVPGGDAPACCTDYDGDGAVDNGLAALAAQLGPVFDADVQDFVDAFIQRGLNAYLVQYRGLDDRTNDPDVGVDLLIGYDSDLTAADNLVGTERFAVRAASYDGPTPKSHFASASIANGRLQARADTMGFLLPLTDEPFVAQVRDVRLDASVTLGDNGRGLALGPVAPGEPGARFSASFPLGEVYRAVNTFAAGGCACLDLGGADLIVGTGNDWSCTQADASACNPADDEESICVDLATYCSAALVLLEPDVGDALSVGLWIQAVSAGFEGLVDASDEPVVCP